MKSGRQTKAQELAGVQALITGTRKHFPNGTLTLGNATFTPDAIVGVLQALDFGLAPPKARSPLSAGRRGGGGDEERATGE
jgi:hypothetical protein